MSRRVSAGLPIRLCSSGAVSARKWTCICLIYVISIAAAYHLGLLSSLRNEYSIRVGIFRTWSSDQIQPVVRPNGFECSINRGQRGSTRCGRRDVGWGKGIALPVRIYQLFHSQECHKELYDCTHPLYQGLAQVAGVGREGYNDFDATSFLDIMREAPCQNNLCEYTGFFGLLAAGYLDDLGRSYVGFQSWKARKKGWALSCEGERGLVNSVWHMILQEKEAFFYWAGLGMEFDEGMALKFYYSSSKYHTEKILDIFRETFAKMFDGKLPEGLEDGLPPMPDDDEPWAYMSYFALPAPRLKEYLIFAAHFWAVIANQWKVAMEDPMACPIKAPASPDEILYSGQHCFCYVLERLVNIWVYHKGLPFYQVFGKNGTVVERHPLEKRKMVPWFRDGGLEASLKTLRSRQKKEATELVKKLLVGLV